MPGTNRVVPVRPQRPAGLPIDLGIVDGLVQLSFLIQSLLGRIAVKHGVTVVQGRLIGILRDREIGMLELSKILELEKSSVTGLVDRAERRGLVRRVAVSGDRRAVRVVLTPDGHDLVHTISEDVVGGIAELTGILSPTQQQRLSEVATTLVFSDAQRRSIPIDTSSSAHTVR